MWFTWLHLITLKLMNLMHIKSYKWIQRDAAQLGLNGYYLPHRVKQYQPSVCTYVTEIITSIAFVIRSTSKSRPNNIRRGKCPSVRPSTKSFIDLNEIWYVGRGR